MNAQVLPLHRTSAPTAGMTTAQANAIVRTLLLAFPSSRKAMEAGSAKLYVAFLVELNFEVARTAVSEIIRDPGRESDFCPTVGEIRKACQAVSRRRRQEQLEIEGHEIDGEPTDDERRKQAEEMRAWMTAKWGDWERASQGTVA